MRYKALKFARCSRLQGGIHLGLQRLRDPYCFTETTSCQQPCIWSALFLFETKAHQSAPLLGWQSQKQLVSAHGL